jgi:hypothetical protein
MVVLYLKPYLVNTSIIGLYDYLGQRDNPKEDVKLKITPLMTRT